MKKFDISNLESSEQEVVGYYTECHGPSSKEELHEWVYRMIDMLGFDDCQFLIKSRQPHISKLWMTKKHHYLYEPNIALAGRFLWGEAAVKITNNTKLEAIRIVNENEAVDSKGHKFYLKPAPAPIPVVEGLPPMPADYQGRWDLNYGDGDFGSGGKTPYGIDNLGQNGEQQPDVAAEE